MEELRNKIPEGWKLKKISDIGCSYGGLTGKRKDNFGVGSSKYISFLNVLNNPIINTKILEQVDVKAGEKQNEVRKGDLFFNTSSETPEEVGICSVLLEELCNTYLNSFCFGFRLTDDTISGLYLAYYFRSKYGRELMTTLAQGATRYNLSKNNFEKSYILVPETNSEQNKIALCLSNIDTLIYQLEVLIEKKKAIKQGAMQELLTGKRRLKGFKEPWEEIKLGKVGEAIRGVSFTPNKTSIVNVPNYIPLLRSNNISDDRICYDGIVYVLEDCVSLKQIMREGDILICAANGSRRLVGKSGVCHEKGKYTFGAFMCVFRCYPEYNTDYVGYLLQSSQYKKQLEDILTGSAINNLNGSQVESLHFTIPTDNTEQRAIASVLQNMDNEIDQLIIKHSKYIAVKQGMMQQLLTGKIRLI